MSTEPKIPQILERDSIIILSADIECSCGRLKDKTHCPACGRVRLYGMAETVIATTPSGDVIKGCHVYRCLGCAKKFNDVDWYFNCHAPIKIDWAATKEKAMQDLKAKKTKEWMQRIELGHHFDYNDRQKCKAETDSSLADLIEAVKNLNKHRTRLNSSSSTLDDQITQKRNQIKNREQMIFDDPANADDHRMIVELLQKDLDKLLAEKLKENNE